MLLVVLVVAIVVRRLRIPYTVALVLAGLLISFLPTARFVLTPEVILALFLPPLIFEAAFHIEFARLRTNIFTILVLAVPGVVLTMLIVGWVVHQGVQIALPTALVFGALIAATDPVAVVALFRTLGAPKNLAVTVEGESLFNDGTAIVLFNLMLTAALAAGANGGNEVSLNIVVALGQFFVVAVGGLVVGVGLGWLTQEVISRLDDYLIEITLTTVLAFGAYLVAEQLHVSGVLAVVGAGIVAGNVGPRGMSPTTRIVLVNFWEYVAFLANSFVFLLIGLDINVTQLWENIAPIGVAVAAVLLSRALISYGLTWLVNRRQNIVPTTYKHVLFWGGLRGAVSLALVLSLPVNMADRDLLRVMTFGVVLFSLLVQGTTMPFLLRRLGLGLSSETALAYERGHARLMLARGAYEHLRRLHDNGVISATTWDEFDATLKQDIENYSTRQRELLHTNPSLLHEERDDALREALRAQRVVLGDLLNVGTISEIVHDELVVEIDTALENRDATVTTLTVPLQAPPIIEEPNL